jgi:lambda family phage portal protein
MNLLNLDLPPMSEIVRERDAQLRKRELSRLRGQRGYQAGKINRLNRDWSTMQTSARADVYRYLRPMRARHRVLAKNSDHFKKFLSLMRNNVAGPFGMTLKFAGGTEEQNAEVLAAYKTWCHKEHASVSRRLSFTMILRRIMTVWPRDGECLVRKIYGKNKFDYTLKFIDVNWLDENYNETRPNGNRVIMSIEIDADDRPVAYWLTPPAADFALGMRPTVLQRTRVPANEIFHLVLPDDENAGDDTLTRGVPWGHTGSLSLFNLDRADEAALISMRAGASKMGFFEHETDTDEEDETETQSKGPVIDHFEPGTFWDLDPGVKFTAFDPQFPNQSHDPFAKYILRRASAGLDTSYHSLTGDLSDVNFSSIRFGVEQERLVYISLQEELKELFCRPNMIDLVTSMVLTGYIKTVRPRDLENFLEPVYQGHRWPYFEPVKDVQAKRLAIEAGLDTVTDALAEQGKDIREIFEKRKAELELAKEMGVPLAAGAGSLIPGTLDAQGEEKPAANPPNSHP